jgi:hypothetical protein
MEAVVGDSRTVDIALKAGGICDGGRQKRRGDLEGSKEWKGASRYRRRIMGCKPGVLACSCSRAIHSVADAE